jgi:hypothetical protein
MYYLAHRFRRRGPLCHLNHRRVDGGSPDQRFYLVRHGRREEEALASGWKRRDDLSDGWQKSHVVHPVSLIKDHYLNRPETQVPASKMIKKPSGSSYQKIEPTCDATDLGSHTHTTNHDCAAQL